MAKLNSSGNVNGKNDRRMEYRTISGAWTPRPMYYCAYYKAYLTEPQARQHHCRNKHGKGICVKLTDLDRKGIKVTNEQKLQSLLDKILNKLTHIDMNISRMQKQCQEHHKDQPNETALDVKRGR